MNPQWAQDLIQQAPIKMVTTRIVSNDFFFKKMSNASQVASGGGPLGHPKVYINLDDGKPHACPYSGQLYQLDPNAKH